MLERPRWHAFADRTAASRALVERVAAELKAALAARAHAALVVSGGSSPLQFLRLLSGADLDWARLTIVPSDERRVPPDDPARNERMIRAELLQGPAAAAGLLSLGDGAPSALETRLQRLLPFAGVVLGLGEDGHTASLFPAAPSIAAALESAALCLDQEVPGLPAPRVSLTPRALLASDRIHLLFFGHDKKRVFDAALEPGPAESLPVRAVLHQSEVPVDAWWAP